MIKNIRLQRTDGNVARVRLPVGFDFIRFAAHEQRREFEIANCIAKTAKTLSERDETGIEPFHQQRLHDRCQLLGNEISAFVLFAKLQVGKG